jgi:hypothetical protein
LWYCALPGVAAAIAKVAAASPPWLLRYTLKVTLCDDEADPTRLLGTAHEGTLPGRVIFGGGAERAAPAVAVTRAAAPSVALTVRRMRDM